MVSGCLQTLPKQTQNVQRVTQEVAESRNQVLFHQIQILHYTFSKIFLRWKQSRPTPNFPSSYLMRLIPTSKYFPIVSSPFLNLPWITSLNQIMVTQTLRRSSLKTYLRRSKSAKEGSTEETSCSISTSRNTNRLCRNTYRIAVNKKVVSTEPIHRALKRRV